MRICVQLSRASKGALFVSCFYAISASLLPGEEGEDEAVKDYLEANPAGVSVEDLKEWFEDNTILLRIEEVIGRPVRKMIVQSPANDTKLSNGVVVIRTEVKADVILGPDGDYQVIEYPFMNIEKETPHSVSQPGVVLLSGAEGGRVLKRFPAGLFEGVSRRDLQALLDLVSARSVTPAQLFEGATEMPGVCGLIAYREYLRRQPPTVQAVLRVLTNKSQYLRTLLIGNAIVQRELSDAEERQLEVELNDKYGIKLTDVLAAYVGAIPANERKRVREMLR